MSIIQSKIQPLIVNIYFTLYEFPDGFFYQSAIGITINSWIFDRIIDDYIIDVVENLGFTVTTSCHFFLYFIQLKLGQIEGNITHWQVLTDVSNFKEENL